MSFYAITNTKKNPSGPASAEKFNTCRLTDYKEKVIVLLKKSLYRALGDNEDYGREAELNIFLFRFLPLLMLLAGKIPCW